MKRSKHSFTVREGVAHVRVWRNITRRKGKEYAYWEFRYLDEHGQAKRCNRASKQQAREEAKKVAKTIAEGAGAAWTAEDTSAYRAVRKNLYGCGVSPDVATYVYAKCREMLATIGRDNVEEAVTFYVEHHRGGITDKSIQTVVAELVEARARDGRGTRHVQDLKHRLERFAREVKCRMADLSAPVIDRWLANLTPVRRTRRNYRAALSNLFRFARDQHYVPSGFDPMKAIPAPKAEPPKRGVFTPSAMERLLRHAPDKLLPVLLLGGFAGLRQSEILLLSWDDVNLKENRIRVPEEGKTGGRYAPLHDNQRAWLYPMRAKGAVVKLAASGVSKAIVRLVARVNRELEGQASRERVKWPHNGPRHSYASYRCAETRNPVTTADEMGHDVRELARSYRNQRVTPEEAAAWFGLLPKRAENVLEFDFGKKFSPDDAKTLCSLSKSQ